MATGDPAPTLCPYCGNHSVYPKQDRADGGVWVWIDWCNVCSRVTS